MSLEERIAEIVRQTVREELARAQGGPGEVLVSYPEAARRLGCSLRTVQRRVRERRLEVIAVAGESFVKLPAALVAA